MTPASHNAPTAIITGGSKGLGLALARGLAERGWSLVIDARHERPLRAAASGLSRRTTVTALAGDVTDASHRGALAAAAQAFGGPHLLVHNASSLGPASPQPTLANWPADQLAQVFAVNAFAPLALTQLLLPALRDAGGTVLAISSDAAVEAHPGWGAYAASKAALDRLCAVLAAEEPALRVYAVDPGDLRTDLHQQAFPDEDVSDRPEPESVVPAVLRLLNGDLPSGRYRASDLRTLDEVPA